MLFLVSQKDSACIHINGPGGRACFRLDFRAGALDMTHPRAHARTRACMHAYIVHLHLVAGITSDKGRGGLQYGRMCQL